jgi:hypothetical protein
LHNVYLLVAGITISARGLSVPGTYKMDHCEVYDEIRA